MAYSKLHTVVSDFAVGVQSVNGAIDNNAALYSQFDLLHSTGLRGGGVGDPFLQLGQHDDPLIARSVAQYQVDATTGVAFPLLGGPMLPNAPQRIDVGHWRIDIATPQIFSVEITPRGTAVADRHACARVVNDPSGPYVLVTTWNVAAGARADMDFDLVLLAEGVA